MSARSFDEAAASLPETLRAGFACAPPESRQMGWEVLIAGYSHPLGRVLGCQFRDLEHRRADDVHGGVATPAGLQGFEAELIQDEMLLSPDVECDEMLAQRLLTPAQHHEIRAWISAARTPAAA